MKRTGEGLWSFTDHHPSLVGRWCHRASVPGLSSWPGQQRPLRLSALLPKAGLCPASGRSIGWYQSHELPPAWNSALTPLWVAHHGHWLTPPPFTHSYTYPHIHTHTFTRTPRHMALTHTHICRHMHTHADIGRHTRTHPHTSADTHRHPHIYIPMISHTASYSHLGAHTPHMHTHTVTHTCTGVSLKS